MLVSKYYSDEKLVVILRCINNLFLLSRNNPIKNEFVQNYQNLHLNLTVEHLVSMSSWKQTWEKLENFHGLNLIMLKCLNLIAIKLFFNIIWTPKRNTQFMVKCKTVPYTSQIYYQSINFIRLDNTNRLS